LFSGRQPPFFFLLSRYLPLSLVSLADNLLLFYFFLPLYSSSFTPPYSLFIYLFFLFFPLISPPSADPSSQLLLSKANILFAEPHQFSAKHMWSKQKQSAETPSLDP
jgi:hypothetical protein